MQVMQWDPEVVVLRAKAVDVMAVWYALVSSTHADVFGEAATAVFRNYY
jgi:hypothetical protein